MNASPHATRLPVAPCKSRQPNEVDLRRIRRSLEKRVRYRYVTPSVEIESGGYRVVSPCCSRNVDPGGGTIDIARFEFSDDTGVWTMFRRDHGAGAWRYHSSARRLDVLLQTLGEDPLREFWQ